MRLTGRGTGNEGIQTLDPMCKTMPHQKVERTICHGRLRPHPVSPQNVQDIIRPDGPVLLEQYFHNPPTDRSQMQVVDIALHIDCRDCGINTVGMVMFFKSDGCHEDLICYNIQSSNAVFSQETIMTVRLAAVLSCITFPALAAPPAVLADIGPVHSMVARVMDGVGTPGLMLPPGVTPHGYSMRPSEADALDRAEIVFWAGDVLTPWLGDAIETLADDAITVELLDILPKAADASKVDQGDENGGADDPDLREREAHAWLDPANGKIWLAAIADVLAKADPENAIIYAANAEAGQAELDALAMEIQTRLNGVKDRGFVVFHDAYGPFEDRFGLKSVGAISVGDAAPPSAAQVAALRSAIVALRAVCVFSEPQFNSGIVKTLMEGTSVRAGTLDPLGAIIEPGKELYPTLLRNMSLSFETCLTELPASR